MKVAITLGYIDAAGRGEPLNLYTGNDATAAREICENPPAGIAATEMYVNPRGVRRRVHARPEAAAEEIAADEVAADEKPKKAAEAKKPKKDLL